MDTQRLVVLLLALAVAVGIARVLWFAWRRAPVARPRAWRLATLAVMQLAAAALLYRVLVPPSVTTGVGTLVVATAGTPANAVATLAPDERLVALPEAPPLSAAERVPDLATALRRHAGTARLRVVGSGLSARDRESARGIPLSFEPVPLPRGLVELSTPASVPSGADFRVRGRARGVRVGSAELLDPSGQRIDREPLDGEGRFTLLAAVRTAGQAEFRLRLFDAGGQRVDDALIPLFVVAPRQTRLLVLAGGPDAELKFLRRWAIDSGTRIHSQIQLGGGMQLGDAPIAFNAATLKGFDAAIVDERAWDALGDARRRALTEAVHAGLGLLVRVTGPLPASSRRSLSSLGLRFADAAQSTTFALPSPEGSSDFAAVRLGPGSPDAAGSANIAGAPLPRLSRAPLRIDVANAHAWLRDSEGRPLAAWRALGRGRVGAWLPTDTYQLVLLGREDLHAALWSEATGTIARAGTEANFAMPANAREGERIGMCGLSDDASITAPDGSATTLLVDPATGPARCAGFWPQAMGWHALRNGRAEIPFHVRGGNELPGLQAVQLREATQRLTLAAGAAPVDAPTHPGPRWPWFLAWLLASAAMWWFERSRLGRPAKA
ncbi:carboxypeptidase regulatory-like domain-containing protein [Lysobacter niabensis]|uniref:carboxypeptidase regulatory-like domain-containing protein n=1 Tax=Agrilutibacter niabensis TaxID=380628 RepID=UPI00360B85E4